MNHYAFKYTDGINTTTGDGASFRAAGTLYSFASKKDRDAYAETSTGHAGGGLIHAVKRSEIPHGHKPADAVELELFEGKYRSEEEIALIEGGI